MSFFQPSENTGIIYGLFIVSGLFFGGAYVAWKNKSIFFLVLTLLVAISSLAVGLYWLVLALNQEV